jgi:iron complex outermembrane receptor protein
MSKRPLLGAAAMAALLPGLAHAEAAAPASQAANASNASMVGEVIVTAQRRSERLVDVPIAIVAQTGEQLNRARITDTRDLQQVTPGLSFTTQGAWAEPNLRGVTTLNSSAGQESPIAIYVDGVYQVSQVASVFSLPDVDQIEVLKGPQGTLFGRNAEGGAISIHTRDPLFKASADVSATLGYYTGYGGSRSSPDYQVKGFLTAPIVADVLAGSVAFYQQDLDKGYLHDLVGGGSFGKKTTTILRGKLRFEPTTDLKFTAAAYYSRVNDRVGTAGSIFPGSYAMISAVPTGIVPTGQWQTATNFPTFIHIKTYGGSLQGVWTTDEGSLSSLTAYTHDRNDASVGISGGAVADPTQRFTCYITFRCVQYEVPTAAKSLSQEFVWTSRKYDKFNFIAGVFLFRSDDYIYGIANAAVCPNCAISFNRVVDTTYSGFAEVNYDLTDQLTLILGGRYNYDHKNASQSPNYGAPVAHIISGSWNSFTPRVSLRYKLDDESNVYATFSRGFKSGVVNAAPVALIPPEKLTAYEVGYKRNTSVYSIAASAFYYDYKNLQVFTFSGSNVGNIVTSAANSTIYGVDVDGTLKVSPDFQVRLGISYLPRARYDTYNNATFYGPDLVPGGLLATHAGQNVSGKRLLKTPKVTGTFGGDYSHDFAGGKLDATLSLAYSDPLYWENGYRVKTKTHYILNGQVSFTPVNSNFTVSVWGKNLTNSYYLAGLVEDALSDLGVAGAPQEVGVTVGYKY